MRRFFLIALMVSLLAIPIQSAAADSPGDLGSLRKGVPLFFDGPGGVEAEEITWWGPYEGFDVIYGSTYAYDHSLQVPAGLGQLRLAVDFPPSIAMSGSWIEVIDPSGTYHDAELGGFFSVEAIILNPMEGDWLLSVRSRANPDEMKFRGRALVEDIPQSDSRPRRLLAPNLRVEPPYDFGFTVPPHWTAPASDQYPSCTPDEVIDDGSTRCMRLTVGAQNTGAGPLELRYSSVADHEMGRNIMYQRLRYSDGSTREREAGTYEYHKTHGHYHFLGFSKLELLKVTDRASGKMVDAGDGHKVGFCLGDIQIAEWNKFVQDKAYSAQSDCDNPTQAWMGLSTGWTDVYTWSTPGNYVDFGSNGDGYYVVRATVDAARGILETNERDNVGYAYIRVTGDDVRLIERGQGRDPWDRSKTIFVDWWQPS